MSKKERGNRYKPRGKGSFGTGRWRVRPGQQALKVDTSDPTNRQERRAAAAQAKRKQRGDV